MTTSATEILTKSGWRLIGRRRNGYGWTRYWDHPEHQPSRRGAFTTTDAMHHQQIAANEGCDCIRAIPAMDAAFMDNGQ